MNVSPSQAKLESFRAAEHPQCLLCSVDNPFGLKLRFRVQEDGSVLAVIPCRKVLQSYPERLHGGVVSALLDAAMTNSLFSVGIVAVTAELTVRFLSPVRLDGDATVRAAVEKSTTHSLHYTKAELVQEGKVMARASAKFLGKGG